MSPTMSPSSGTTSASDELPASLDGLELHDLDRQLHVALGEHTAACKLSKFLMRYFKFQPPLFHTD